MPALQEQIALVTGASRGVGRGVAIGLAKAGVQVFATGRTVMQVELCPGVTPITCDHTDDQAVAHVFRTIEETTGKLDILVNVAWGGYERMVEDGRFTFISPFWQQPLWRWDAMITAGVRAAFVASQHAARDIRLHGPGQRLHRRRQGEDRQSPDGPGEQHPGQYSLGDVELHGPR